MNFHHSTLTTRRPQNTSSNFNEDAHCDNEVNLILEKNYNQHILEQSIYKKQQQESVVINQAGQYYFIPIREQSSTMALASNNTCNVTDGSSMLLPDPSGEHLFDYASTMNSSDLTTVNKLDNNFHFTDADLAALFVSSLVSTTTTAETEITENNDKLSSNQTLDEVFLQQVNDLVGPPKEKSVGPPPGFENFHFDTSSDNSTSLPPISAAAALQTQVSSSDTINFSQLLQMNIADAQQQQSLGGNVRSSSSSHSSFTSDEQSIFFPMSTRPHHSSTSSSSSQIASTNKPGSSLSSTTSQSNNSIAKPYMPNSLSSNTKSFSSLHTSNTTSPISTKTIETETIIHDGDVTPNSFFTNGHTDFPGTKPPTTKTSLTNNRQSSSSTSSSTSSSIDDALIQLTQQQRQQAPTHNKLFPDESLAIFHFPSSKTKTAPIDHHHQQQLAVNDNINFLVSMAASSTPVTPESPWQQSNPLPHRQTQSVLLQQQTTLSHSPSRNLSAHMQELMESLNELCYRGFDELNALIQEQRWVQNYLNVNSSSLPSPSSPSVNFNGGSCCSAQILIVPDYFIYKCQKVEITASHVYELLAVGRPELRLRDLMFAFKSWKESIANAKLIHQEEETKLRLIMGHSHPFHTNEAAFQAAFDRVCYAIRQLGTMTQQARAAFQYATLNVFQMSSRQPTSQSQSSSNALAFAQFQAMQQQKSSNHRNGGSIRTTP